MFAVVQRVDSATVFADGVLSGKIGNGLYILLGVESGDSEKDVSLLSAKIAKLRIFSDENDKMNLSVVDVGGNVLVVSNFTLCANYSHGNRPDYLLGEKPDAANRLYERFIEEMKKTFPDIQTGKFGADMKTEMVTNGPVTLVLNSSVLGGNSSVYQTLLKG